MHPLCHTLPWVLYYALCRRPLTHSDLNQILLKLNLDIHNQLKLDSQIAGGHMCRSADVPGGQPCTVIYCIRGTVHYLIEIGEEVFL